MGELGGLDGEDVAGGGGGEEDGGGGAAADGGSPGPVHGGEEKFGERGKMVRGFLYRGAELVVDS